MSTTAIGLHRALPPERAQYAAPVEQPCDVGELSGALRWAGGASALLVFGGLTYAGTQWATIAPIVVSRAEGVHGSTATLVATEPNRSLGYIEEAISGPTATMLGNENAAHDVSNPLVDEVSRIRFPSQTLFTMAFEWKRGNARPWKPRINPDEGMY